MAIRSTGGNLHWNYFLALERDLEVVSRYVELTEQNYETYSIELAHLLFAAASEVDVVAKLLCERVAPEAPRNNIAQYQAVLLPAFPELPGQEVRIERYGLSFCPWDNWARDNESPFWWRSYNKVKHERDAHFNEATVRNTLNALGALLIFIYNYHMRMISRGAHSPVIQMDVDRILRPAPALMRVKGDPVYEHIRRASGA
jgi:hypothetical protein